MMISDVQQLLCDDAAVISKIIHEIVLKDDLSRTREVYQASYFNFWPFVAVHVMMCPDSLHAAIALQCPSSHMNPQADTCQFKDKGPLD